MTLNISQDIRRTASREDGMALVTVILVTMLCAALMVGFTAAIVTDQRSAGIDRDQSQAYAAAHAGLEKLTSDLSSLFRRDFAPSTGDMNALTVAGQRPSIPVCQGSGCPNFQYISQGGGSGYTITWPYPDASGNPGPESTTGSVISSGPYQGLKGLITPYDLTVTARSPTGGAEVRLRRRLQTVSIPVFQFGMFSETDLAFHAGDDFTFAGRVHTNQNLFLAQATGSTLTFTDRITAFGHIVRTHLPNDLPTTSGYDGAVRVPTIIKSPFNATTDTRLMTRSEGSLTGSSGLPSSSPTSSFWTNWTGNWTTISTGYYKSNIRNGGASGAPQTDPVTGEVYPPYTKAHSTKGTGARRLDLPIVADDNGDGQPDASAIELIRRPPLNDPTFILRQRYFSLASLRILLSDDINDIQNLQFAIGAPNPSVTNGVNDQPVLLQRQPITNNRFHYVPLLTAPQPFHPPLPESAGGGVGPSSLPANVYLSNGGLLGEPLLGGYIKIEMQRQNNIWVDVTREILNLGFVGRNLASTNAGLTNAQRWNSIPANAAETCADPHPDAVIRLMRVRDIPQQNAPCGIGAAGAVSQNPTDYWPNVLYDTREANTRDAQTTTDLRLGGVMHYVELDMNNLRRWFRGQIGANGNQARNDNGFIVYFSDRRNNNDAANNETGEYGWEDTVNLASGGTPNGGAAEIGEDINSNNALDVYGGTAKAQNVPGGAAGQLIVGAHVFNTALNAATSGANPNQIIVKALQARANKAIVFRRALKIVNGGIQTVANVAGTCSGPGAGNAMATPCNNIMDPNFGGVTITSENPVYVQGNFNAISTNANVEPNVATSVIADTVTMLSNNWNDIRSFLSPQESTPTAGSAPFPLGRLNPGRPASTTGYRVAIVTGKTKAFPKPATADASFGSDGGAHNFVRLLENWNNGSTLRYRGSFVSFFYSRQATGSFKCCAGDAYVRGERDWSFDDDFNFPALLPPGTPMFRDVNTLTFRQILRPTQQ
jgi:hypothetical protein